MKEMYRGVWQNSVKRSHENQENSHHTEPVVWNSIETDNSMHTVNNFVAESVDVFVQNVVHVLEQSVFKLINISGVNY